MKVRFFLVLLALLPLGANAGVSSGCETRTKVAFPDYIPAPGSAERGAAVLNSREPYSRTRGDFDGDGKMDWAILLRPKSGNGKFAISVCLSSRASRAPELIPDAYTAGPLSTTPKGRKYLDSDSNFERRYEHDGIGSYCCECCGATYIFRNGQFVAVVDSD